MLRCHSLQSVGMNADAARETITQFGNAVARAGGGAEQFDGVVLALSQISAVGKVTQEDLNQIKERLPEFTRVMKEEFGVVVQETSQCCHLLLPSTCYLGYQSRIHQAVAPLLCSCALSITSTCVTMLFSSISAKCAILFCIPHNHYTW